MPHPMAEFYPPTCLLCRHFKIVPSAQEVDLSIDPTPDWLTGGGFDCAAQHDIDNASQLLQAATCPDFDQITAAQRDAMIQEAGK